MNKKYGEPIEEINGVFEIYKQDIAHNHHVYILYQKCINASGKMYRKYILDSESKDECEFYVSQIINATWDCTMNMSKALHENEEC